MDFETITRGITEKTDIDPSIFEIELEGREREVIRALNEIFEENGGLGLVISKKTSAYYDNKGLNVLKAEWDDDGMRVQIAKRKN